MGPRGLIFDVVLLSMQCQIVLPVHALHHQISKDKLRVQFRGMEKERGFEFEGEDSAFLPSSSEIHHSEGTCTSTAQTHNRYHWFVAKKEKVTNPGGEKVTLR